MEFECLQCQNAVVGMSSASALLLHVEYMLCLARALGRQAWGKGSFTRQQLACAAHLPHLPGNPTEGGVGGGGSTLGRLCLLSSLPLPLYCPACVEC